MARDQLGDDERRALETREEGPFPQRFIALYHAYLDPIYRYCVRRLPTTEDAEDATSLIFTKALTGLPHQRNDVALRSWLFAIAHNVVADHYRSRRPTIGLTAAETLPGSDQVEVHVHDADELRTLLAQLPPEQARVIELRLSGLTGPEIARVLGKSHAAIKVTQFRAYSRLRQLFGLTLDGVEVHDAGR